MKVTVMTGEDKTENHGVEIIAIFRYPPTPEETEEALKQHARTAFVDLSEDKAEEVASNYEDVLTTEMEVIDNE